jgi:hypothetical protein
MDIDRVEEHSVSSPRRVLVAVDDAHPFDLDSYIANYSGEQQLILLAPS